MRDTQLGFHYSWSDLRPVRPLVLAVLLAELVGAAIGWSSLSAPSGFVRLWFGAALSALPGFALGLIVQWLSARERFATHPVLIRRIGLIATLLTTLAAGLMLMLGLDAEFGQSR
ncbi:hypothetical protein [Lysobacter capsici]|uniref:hypothetical protein n=1 Tax=Lysobacter capsici TaxID=435897 RepID=UPI001C0062B7|nr:hypothetical protein [Lysobacter capsici]QWF17179.1 hypothetical protein KME82_26220 [Lysobacter capsici]